MVNVIIALPVREEASPENPNPETLLYFKLKQMEALPPIGTILRLTSLQCERAVDCILWMEDENVFLVKLEAYCFVGCEAIVNEAFKSAGWSTEIPNTDPF